MLNRELKEEFIQNKLDSAAYKESTLRSVIELAGKREDILGKDLCNWTVTEITDYYKTMGKTSDTTISWINRIFKEYTNLCVSRGLSIDSQNHYNEITEEIIRTECLNKNILEKIIFTRKDIENILYKVSEPCDKFLILAPFEGIDGKNHTDLVNICTNDFERVDDKWMVNLPSGKRFEVSDLLVELGRQSENKYEYTSSINRTWNLVGSKILKNRDASYAEPTEASIGRRLYMRLIRLIRESYLPKNLTFNYLKDSGKIDLLKKLSAEKGLSPEDGLYDRDIFDAIVYRYGNIQSRKNFILKYKEFL